LVPSDYISTSDNNEDDDDDEYEYEDSEMYDSGNSGGEEGSPQTTPKRELRQEVFRLRKEVYT
jgi:hypothetical protein